MSDDGERERKTWEQYREDRRKLGQLEAPAMRVTIGSTRNVEYQKEAALDYTLDMVGHLLWRIEELEQRLAEREETTDPDDVPTGGGVEGPFDPNDRPWKD